MLMNVLSGEQFDLSKLRVVTSTGAVLSSELYDWFYEIGFPVDAQLVSMSGGTDIAGCCMYTLRLEVIIR
jgi:acetoacetyl-CoA synthetase